MNQIRRFMLRSPRIVSLLMRCGFEPIKYGQQMLLTNNEEMNLIEEFRKYKAMGMQKGGTVGGCGGCPSAGECGPEIL